MNGVPPIIVVLPCRPAGAPATGTVVGPGIMKPRAGPAGSVVAAGITRKEEPSTMVVLPWRPAGAPARGMVVGPPMTTGP